MERPTYPVPATAMLSGDGEPSLVEEASVNTSEGSNPSNDEPNEVTYATMAAAEKDEDMYGPFDSVADMMEELNA